MANAAAMNKRVLSAALWLFASLYAGSILRETIGMHELVGPVLGFVTAGAILATGVAQRPIALSTSTEIHTVPSRNTERI